MSMNNKTIALIVTQSISLADGLEALLKAIPQIDEVKVTRIVEHALQQVEERRPRILLIDSVLLGTQPEALLEKVNLLSPESQRMLLVDDVQDVKWMPKYAEAILLKGVPPSSVATIVTNLLSSKGEADERNHANQSN